MKYFVYIILIVGLLMGCAVLRYNYSSVVGDLSASGNQSIGVATHDQRPYVLSGNKGPNIVGLIRGGFGNPLNVTTASGAPLADDMTKVIVSSLSRKGFKTKAIVTSHTDSAESVLEKLKVTQGENLVLLTLYEWKSNSYMKTGLYYDANLKIFDVNGETLAESNIKGEDNLGGSMNILKYSKIMLPEALKKKIEELFNNPNVANALLQ
jgi:hypothetical protein